MLFGIDIRSDGHLRIGIDSAADMKDTAELRRQWKPQASEREVGWTVPKREGRGLRPGLLIYVVLTAGAAVGSTGALRRRATLSTPELYRLSRLPC